MRDPAFQTAATTTVSISTRDIVPGPIVHAPAEDHRIIVHLSAAADTACRETGERHRRRRGDIDIVPAGNQGEYDAYSAAKAFEIRLAPRFLERVAYEAGLGHGRRQLETYHMLRNDTIGHLARALSSNHAIGDASDRLYAESIGIALATQLLPLSARLEETRSGLSANQLRRVLDYIEGHLDTTLTIDILSREAGASSSHLRRWFKLATGMTIHRYVVRRRVERAKELLLKNALSTSEIAFACGFAHQSHMARWMRRELNHTPGALQIAQLDAGRLNDGSNDPA